MRTTPQRDGDRPAPTTSAPSDANLKRRRFLFALSAGSAATAAAAAQAVASPVVPVPAAPAAAQGSGYRETEHVRNYYASTRI